MMKLLVTGASGFLGWNLCRLARVKYSLFGTHFSNPIGLDGVTPVGVDLKETRPLADVFRAIEPDAVIHTAAVSQPNLCETEPETSYAMNVLATQTLAQLCAGSNIPFIFTSSDLVFDGTNAPYDENDVTTPISRYGQQKVEAEQHVLEAHPDAAVCRMPLMFGDAPEHAGSFLQPMITSFRAGETLRLFIDEYRTPVSGGTAALGLLLALEQQVSGILHLGGREPVSRFEFGKTLCRILPCTGRIEPVRQADIPMAAARPADVSLRSERAFALGFDPPAIEDQLRALSCLQL